LASYAIGKGYELDWPQTAAFNLQQATEAAYIALLLVIGFYSPRSHNIKPRPDSRARL
jgi:HEPN domain-containing protein